MTFGHAVESDKEFQRRYLSSGDIFGEWFHGYFMVAVVCGITGRQSD
jgi:hypothetical protein